MKQFKREHVQNNLRKSNYINQRQTQAPVFGQVRHNVARLTLLGIIQTMNKKRK